MVRTFTSRPAEPRDRGEEFGAAHPENICAAAEGYERLFSLTSGKSINIEKLGLDAFDGIRRWSPDFAEEIEGIAGGSGVPVGTIAAMNARTEVLAQLAADNKGECSTFVSLGGPNGPDLAGQNWDWHDTFSENWLVWTIEFSEGVFLRTLTEYGILGKIGVNSAGIGLLFNILHHESDGSGPIEAPVHLVARQILEQAGDVHQALKMATSAPATASSSMTLVGRDEEESAAACVEVWPEGPGVLVPENDGRFVRTNHFLSPKATNGDREWFIGPDTFLRFDILNRRLGSARPESTRQGFDLMCSHYGGGGALCAHPEPEATFGDRYATLASVVIDLDRRSMTVRDGGPCDPKAEEVFDF